MGVFAPDRPCPATAWAFDQVAFDGSAVFEAEAAADICDRKCGCGVTGEFMLELSWNFALVLIHNLNEKWKSSECECRRENQRARRIAKMQIRDLIMGESDERVQKPKWGWWGQIISRGERVKTRDCWRSWQKENPEQARSTKAQAYQRLTTATHIGTGWSDDVARWIQRSLFLLTCRCLIYHVIWHLATLLWRQLAVYK